MHKPMDDARDRTKISDKDTPSDLRYTDVVENTNNGALITRSEQIRATQNLVDKKILGSLTLVGDSTKSDSNKGDHTKSSNPFRNKSTKKKKRKSLERELSKLGDEVLAQIPAEKLAQLLESNGEETDTALLSDSLREKLKGLAQGEPGEDDDEDEREIAAMHPTQPSTKPAPSGTKPTQTATKPAQTVVTTQTGTKPALTVVTTQPSPADNADTGSMS